METVFETPRLYVRKLRRIDLAPFHEMQGNIKVMLYTTGRAMTREENQVELLKVIDYYAKPDNDFWVWAVVQKSDDQFVGTCALVKNDKRENEIGYRFIERYWGKGYGKEISLGLIDYNLNRRGINEIVAYVNKANLASVKILDATFDFVKEFYNEKEECVDRYYKVSQ